jgi:hypothetical protein
VDSADCVTYRPPVWRRVVASYLPAPIRVRADRWIIRLPVVTVILAMTAMVVRLHNTAFVDEANFANAGQLYANHWLHGGRIPALGATSPGVPIMYPVVSGALEMIGGLRLTRVFSLLLLIVAVQFVRLTTRQLFGSRAATLAAAALAFCGPVLVIGALGTADAACLAAISLALYLGIVRSSLKSAVGVGVAAAAAVSFQYVCVLFVPLLLAAVISAGREPLRRAALAGSTAALVLSNAYIYSGSSLRSGILSATVERKTLSPAPPTSLFSLALLDIGLLGFIAILGAAAASLESRGLLVLAITLLTAAALLPCIQLYLGESVSFEKNLGYSALFLAPLAGRGMATLTRGSLRLAPAIGLVAVTFVVGLSRSWSMYQWPNVAGVVKVINQAPVPGVYLSSMSESLRYYTANSHPGIQWEGTATLYSKGPAEVRMAISEHRYANVILRSGTTGSVRGDAEQKVLDDALSQSRDYLKLPVALPVQSNSPEQWLIFSARS